MRLLKTASGIMEVLGVIEENGICLTICDVAV